MRCGELDLNQTKAMFVYVTRSMVDQKDALTQADKAIGDGDHGIGMARGFEAVETVLAEREFISLGELFNNIGLTLLAKTGGAAGAVFGTLFRGGSRNLGEQKTMNTHVLATFLQDGLDAIKARGGARPGDKTMIDALDPAVRKAKEMHRESLDQSLPAITEAARLGMEKTREMVAIHGKAKTLGARSVGFPDPGAISLYLILNFMNEFLARECAGNEG
jgi:phosphoenolpyruvate---glycerone phosphotransferase subunit DhaL